MPLSRLLITTGEPAGIGPELLVKIAQQQWPAQLIAIGNAGLLRATAEQMNLPLTLSPFVPGGAAEAHRVGHLSLIDLPLEVPVRAGQLDPANAGFVLTQLQQAAQLALDGKVDAIVTNPLQKSVLNEAGIKINGAYFSGHTEFFAQAADAHTGTATPVLMLLANDFVRVALLTTHMPLSAVPAAITAEKLQNTLHLLHAHYANAFGINKPRIAVLGLNPHAGENGHMGREEIEVITPVLNELRAQGMNITGPMSADTAFTPDKRVQYDVYLAMYHDQGLPVLKALGFHRSVNITLGLPFIRTSVDHGTALDLAGKNCADAGSLHYAITTALEMIARKSH